MYKTISTLILMSLIACSSTSIKSVSPKIKISSVCIKENSETTNSVPEFLSVLQEGFTEHGISSQTYTDVMPDTCEYVVTYSAEKKVDFGRFLANAEITIETTKQQVVAHAAYKQSRHGSVFMNKWGSVKKKMTPVIDKLLNAKH